MRTWGLRCTAALAAMALHIQLNKKHPEQSSSLCRACSAGIGIRTHNEALEADAQRRKVTQLCDFTVSLMLAALIRLRTPAALTRRRRFAGRAFAPSAAPEAVRCSRGACAGGPLSGRYVCCAAPSPCAATRCADSILAAFRISGEYIDCEAEAANRISLACCGYEQRHVVV